MKAKFNKHTQRWGVWVPAEGTWLPVKFQSKQEAERHVRENHVTL